MLAHSREDCVMSSSGVAVARGAIARGAIARVRSSRIVAQYNPPVLGDRFSIVVDNP